MSKKTRYIAYVDQRHRQCQSAYTIVCGKELWLLDAQTYEDAIVELRTRILGKMCVDADYGHHYWQGGYWDDRSLNYATVYGVTDVFVFDTIDLDKWYAEASRQLEVADAEKNENHDRAEYERLKAKYER